jgi:hypothetical protein
MPYRIPNVADATYNAQAEVFASNFNDLAGGIAGAGVLSGCEVAPGSGTLELDVSAGVVAMALDGVRTTVDATTVTLSENPSGQHGNNARIDVVQANVTTGVVDVNEGTIASEPVEPDVNTDCVKLAAVYVPPDTLELTTDMISDRRILVYTADTAISKALVNSSYMSSAINADSGYTGHNFTDLNEMTFPYTSPVLFQTRNTFENGESFLFVCNVMQGAFLMNPHTDVYGLAPVLQYSIDFAEAGTYPGPTPGNWRALGVQGYAINYVATADFPWFQALPPFLLTLQLDDTARTDVVDYTSLANPFNEENVVDPEWTSVDMWTSFRWSIPSSGQVFTAGTDYPVGDTAVSNVGIQAVSQLFGSSTVTRVPGNPVFTSLTPASGPEAGGTTVTITGTGFVAITGVTFDSEPATSVVTVSDTEITCVTPAGTGALVDVVITSTYGTSQEGAGTFTYVGE